MPSDDELRRVAEDVRALARSLGKDIRAAVVRGREAMYGPGGAEGHAGRRWPRQDLAAAGRAARDELWSAQQAVRESARQHRRHRDERRHAAHGPSTGCGPRWDNWGGGRYRSMGDHDEIRPPARCVRDGAGRRDRDQARQLHTVPAAPIRHRHDGSTLVGLLAVVFGLAWLAAATNLASVSAEAVLAVALLVVGATTVVTARTDWALSGRSWPVVAGAVVGVALLASSASSGLPIGFRHLEFGVRIVTPAAWTDLPPVMHAGFGKTQVDLASLSSPLPSARTFTIDNAAGRLEITLPNIPVLLHAHVAAGQLQINGVATSGTNRRDVETLNPTAPGPALTLNVDAGFASVDVISGGLTPRSAGLLNPTNPPPPTAVPAGVG